MRMPRCPAATEATCGRICKLAARHLQAERRNPEALGPHRVGNEWAIGKLRRTRLRRVGALSAVFGRAARRGNRAITDFQAWAQRAVEAAVSAAVVEAGAAVAAAADADRGREKP